MTPERIAEIEKLAETMMTKFLSCEPDPVKVREFEKALMELIGSCLRERDAEIERLRLNNAAQECLLAEAVTGARETEAELSALRARVEKLEKVREVSAALVAELDRRANGNDWPLDLGCFGDALEAALAAARGE